MMLPLRANRNDARYQSSGYRDETVANLDHSLHNLDEL